MPTGLYSLKLDRSPISQVLQLFSYGFLAKRQACSNRTCVSCSISGNNKSRNQRYAISIGFHVDLIYLFSFKWNCHCYWEEIIIYINRRLHARQSGRCMPKHRDRVFRNGAGFQGFNCQGPKKRAGILEDIRWISTNAGLDTGNRNGHATGNAVRVCIIPVSSDRVNLELQRRAAIRRLSTGRGMGHQSWPNAVSGGSVRVLLGLEG